MFNLQKLREELLIDEGIRLVAYKDTQDFWTIGVGHLLGRDKRMSKITFQEAYALLNSDIDIAIATARSAVPLLDKLDDVRQRALINMAFNRGQHMVTSSMLTPAINMAANSGDWSHVREVGISSQWASQVGMRANRLLNMLQNGTFA